MRIVIWPDTNSLFGDPYLKNAAGQKIRGNISDGNCEVHFSPIVMKEVQRKIDDSLDEELARIKSRSDRSRRIHGVNNEALKIAARKYDEKLRRHVVKEMDQLTALNGVQLAPWPTVSAPELAERELGRRRPFLDGPTGTVGFRDALIWLGLVELLETADDISVIFATQDQGFLDKRSKLHPSLQQELAERGIAASRVHTAPHLFAAASVVDVLRKAADARLETAKTAIYDTTEDLRTQAWGYTFDPRSGSSESPQYEIGLPAEMESVVVLSAEFEMAGPLSETENNIYVGTYEASLELEGVMAKSTWYSQEFGDLELWDGELNDHFLSVYTVRTIEVTAQVELHPKTDEPIDIQILSIRSEH